MSDRQKFENMLQEYFNEDSPNRITEYVVITASQNIEDDRPITGYSYACTEHIPHSHLLGLMAVGQQLIDENVEEADG